MLHVILVIEGIVLTVGPVFGAGMVVGAYLVRRRLTRINLARQ